MEAKNILDYWKDLEFFSPDSITDSSYKNFSEGIKFPWLDNTETDCIFKVYLGNLSTNSIIMRMIDAIKAEDSRIEVDNSKSLICALNISENGFYIQESFNISHFVWACCQIIKNKTLDVELNENRIDQFNSEINSYICSLDRRLDEEAIKLIIEKTYNALEFVTEANLITGKYKKQKIKEKDDIDDTATDIFPSFYINDLELAKAKIDNHKFLKAFIESQNDNSSNTSIDRLEVDKEVLVLKDLLNPKNYPFGKWPTAFNPSFMQQVAINLSTKSKEEGEIFSVNGPPGTGKTTLLKEIIADNIVKRAKVMTSYSKPSDAFKKVDFEHPTQYHKYYYELDELLCSYGMIVASNNNLAVENISCELPLLNSVRGGKSGIFDNCGDTDIYFNEIVSNILGEDKPTWGLISARLGNKENISKFINAYYYGSKENNKRHIRDYFEEEISWTNQKEKFDLKYAEVENYRHKIEEVFDRSIYIHEIEKNEVEEKLNLENKRLELNTLNGSILELNQSICDFKEDINAIEDNIVTIEKILPWYVKIFPFLFKKNSKLMELYRLSEEKLNLSKDLKAKLETLRKLEKNKHILLSQAESIEKKYNAIALEVFEVRQKIEMDRKEFGKNYVDSKFWKDFQSDRTLQITCPWVNDEYDKIREELFYEALQLHKAFICNSEEIKKNINIFINQNNGEILERDKQKFGNSIMNSILISVPVISTTFASVSSFMKYVGETSIGCLILDESGQATPQASVGAILRSKKTIVVGDPFQVEPILTIPKELMIRFAQKHKVNNRYEDQTLSLQQFADCTNKYGGYRNFDDKKNWVGCPLVVHRRSIDSIFNIFNKIAYDNHMINETIDKSDLFNFVFERSQWIDIKGAERGKKDHYVQEQGAYIADRIFSYYNLYKVMPDTFLISPFNSVIVGMQYELQKKFKDQGNINISEWLCNNIGTIHKFQGKESIEVILILGCDSDSGMGAANWVGLKPNMVNVALSRAKFRFVAVGDKAVWQNVKYVRDIINAFT